VSARRGRPFDLSRDRLRHLSGPDAPGAGAHAMAATRRRGRADGLQVDLPRAVGDVIRVTDAVPGFRGLSAELTVLSHGSSLPVSIRKKRRILHSSFSSGKASRRLPGVSRGAASGRSPVPNLSEWPKPLSGRSLSRRPPLTVEKPSVTLTLSRNKSQSKPVTVLIFSVRVLCFSGSQRTWLAST
jgi:hypothetical protein